MPRCRIYATATSASARRVFLVRLAAGRGRRLHALHQRRRHPKCAATAWRCFGYLGSELADVRISHHWPCSAPSPRGCGGKMTEATVNMGSPVWIPRPCSTPRWTSWPPSPCAASSIRQAPTLRLHHHVKLDDCPMPAYVRRCGENPSSLRIDLPGPFLRRIPQPRKPTSSSPPSPMRASAARVGEAARGAWARLRTGHRPGRSSSSSGGLLHICWNQHDRLTGPARLRNHYLLP